MNLPLHERIRSTIEKEILSGALPPGTRLPIERELMERYGCARMTVNKALTALADAGLINRRKRAGSFVARPKVHSMVVDIPDLSVEVERRGQLYHYALVRRRERPADPANADEVALAGSGPLLHIEGVHYADDVPLAVEDRLISLTAVPEMRDGDFTAISPGSWLLRHVPWTEADLRVAAVGADAKVASSLAVASGTPCLFIERRTWRGGEGVTLVRQYFLGSEYDLFAQFAPSRTSSMDRNGAD